MKLFCFRFDVDTYRCIQHGVPNLLTVARNADVPFTFFFNMGRAVSRTGTIRTLLSFATDTMQPASKLSSYHKLGFSGYLISALVNPQVGSANLHVIKRAHHEGHEIGLHGGKNHAHWQKAGQEWDVDTFQQEIEWGLRMLVSAGLPAPVGFASPGWQGSARLNSVLEGLDFEYVADNRGRQHHDITVAEGTTHLADIPTNIVGQPADVAYIENLRARGFDRQQILDDFRSQLREQPNFAVVYEHPYYAGIRELDLMSQMIDVVRSEGFSPVTMHEVVRTFRSSPATTL